MADEKPKHAGGRPRGSRTSKPVRRLRSVEPPKEKRPEKKTLKKKPGEGGGGRA